ncbi:hypothetical protein BJN45_08380 [Azonexus hydrophilus]|uniref:Transcription factor zinc-finger domain-containing protein n=1 Tax=Azonexus hydrophilus TaxID=418702 RepID=A0A1R1I8P5_9RHOO|nr:zf-TFIIB domain-containing protein [Azonexus hydrophilus]OMG55146.1 hypothetical protein BJN45_08380 [Azonexus hydrophilus]
MQPTACPSCRQPMHKRRFERNVHGEVILDLCFHCHGIWFDEFESVQITPGGVVELFRLIHEHRDEQRLPLRDVLHCPRCDERLLHGLDVSKHGGRFNYHRCLQKHGRFTTFAQLMIEKGFVRQLTGAEIDDLASKVGTIRCTGCGAPVDIRHDHACRHCRAPISILDPQAVDKALDRLHQAEEVRSRRDVEMLGDAIVMREREKSRFQREQRENFNQLDIGDLIVSGVDLLARILRR